MLYTVCHRSLANGAVHYVKSNNDDEEQQQQQLQVMYKGDDAKLKWRQVSLYR